MGQYWYRMELKSSADMRIVYHLIQEQQKAYKRCWDCFTNDLHEFLIWPDNNEFNISVDVQQLDSFSQNIIDYIILDFESSHENDHIPITISSISRNQIIPPAWRIECYRSYLLTEVPSFLTRLSTYVNEVRNGKHNIIVKICMLSTKLKTLSNL